MTAEQTPILTEAQARTLLEACELLAELDTELFNRQLASTSTFLAGTLGRMTGLCGVAGDAVFAVVNAANAYGHCPNAAAAIKAHHSR